jgi:hypothetical protein
MTGGTDGSHYFKQYGYIDQPRRTRCKTMGGPLKILDLLALLDGVCLATTRECTYGST